MSRVARVLPPSAIPEAGSRELLRRAVRTLRERPGAIITLAVLVLVLPQLLEAQLGAYSDHLTEIGTEPTRRLGLVLAAVQLTSTLGFVFYAGLLDRIVGEHQWGVRESTDIRHVASELPWIKLLAADVLFLVMVGITGAFFVLPGLILYTYFGLVGPVINIEHRGVFASFARTAQVVRGNFWMVARLVTALVVVEGLIEGALHNLFDHERLFGVVGATVSGVILAGFIGVVEVTVAHELVRRRPIPGVTPTVDLEPLEPEEADEESAPAR